MSRVLQGYTVVGEASGPSGALLKLVQDGERFVGKEFSSYRFPAPEVKGMPFYESARQKAQQYLDKLLRLQSSFEGCCRRSGPLNIPTDVFSEGIFIYKVTKFVPGANIAAEDVHKTLTPNQIDTLISSVLLQLEKLAQIGYIHGDLKPDNIILQKHKKYYLGSVIDYDGGFFKDDIHGNLYLNHTPEYAAPEMLLFQMTAAEDEPEVMVEGLRKLDEQLDLYALGCIYSQYLTGRFLCHSIADDAFIYPGLLQLNYVPLKLPDVNPVRREILRAMTQADPTRRPTARGCLEMLKAARRDRIMQKMEDPFAWLGFPVTGMAAPFDTATRSRKLSDGRFAWFVQDSFRAPDVPEWKSYSQRAARRTERLEALDKRQRAWEELPDALLRFSLHKKNTGCYVITEKSPFKGGRFLHASQIHDLRADHSAVDFVMIRLLEVFGFLHRQGIYHGSLTAESFWFYYTDDGSLEIYFHELWRCSPDNTSPEQSNFDGEPMLLAPEVGIYLTEKAGTEPSWSQYIGPRSDIFALGLIYHCILSGEWPEISPDINMPAVYRALQYEQTNGIAFDSHIDSGHQAVLKKMLDPNPVTRTATAASLSQEILVLLGKE